MGDKLDATKLNIPILKAIGAFATIGAIIWFASSKSTTIEAQGNDIEDLQVEIKSLPNRQEIIDVKNSVERIEASVNTIQDYLIKK